MRIIGGHDYYDSGLAYGQDETLIFLRNAERKHHNRIESTLGISTRRCSARISIPGQKQTTWRLSESCRGHYEQVRDKTNEHVFYVAYVVLCGVLYSGFYVRRRDLGTYLPQDHWIWSVEAMHAYAAEYNLEIDEGRSGSEKSWQGYSWGERKAIDVTLQPLDEWMKPIKLTGKAREYLVEERITIATKDPSIYRNANDQTDWEIDQPNLGKMGFVKAVDPYTAFQEISMWLGGVIPRQGPEIVEITDNRVKIEKHGFHHPTSFRKAKQN